MKKVYIPKTVGSLDFQFKQKPCREHSHLIYEMRKTQKTRQQHRKLKKVTKYKNITGKYN